MRQQVAKCDGGFHKTEGSCSAANDLAAYRSVSGYEAPRPRTVAITMPVLAARPRVMQQIGETLAYLCDHARSGGTLPPPASGPVGHEQERERRYHKGDRIGGEDALELK